MHYFRIKFSEFIWGKLTLKHVIMASLAFMWLPVPSLIRFLLWSWRI